MEETYEPINSEETTPATKADVAKILVAIDTLSEQINNLRNQHNDRENL